MSSLHGARVALLEGRMPGELADLVRRHGGAPYSVVALNERPLEAGAQVASFIDNLERGDLPVVVCSTGVGVTALFEEAERLRRLPQLLTALHQVVVVCRGPKPSAVLRRNGVPITINAQSPYTTPQVLEAMAGLELTDTGVALLHYGERNEVLAEALQAQGARLEELLLYEWRMPEDPAPLRNLVQELLSGTVDAIAFTSQVQVRHLYQMADILGKSGELSEALNTRSIVASVGPVCTAALVNYGVTPDVVPDHPKMGAMIATLARFIEQHPGQSSSGARTNIA